MDTKPKAFFVICSYEYYQSYFETGTIQFFLNHYSLTLLVPASLRGLDLFDIPYIVYEDIPSLIVQLFNGHCLRKTIVLSKSVTGFRLRLRRVHASLQYMVAYGPINLLRRLLRDLTNILFAYILPVGSRYLKSGVITTSYAKVLCGGDPDFIFLPCQAVNVEVFIASYLRRFCGLRSKEVLLVDNWDNLCSKSSFLVKPAFVGVYANQAMSFCDRIHSLQSSSVFIWGSPRYQIYHNVCRDEEGSTLPFRITYAGTSCFYDEIADLHSFASAMSTVSKDYCISYLPHPWRTVPRKYRHLLSNPLPDKVTKVNRNGCRDLKYLYELLSNSSFTIAGPTSIILESLILKKKTIISLPDGKYSLQSPSEIYYGYEHFRGLESNPLVRVCSSLSDYTEALLWAVASPSEDELSFSHEHLQFYVSTNQDFFRILLTTTKHPSYSHES